MDLVAYAINKSTDSINGGEKISNELAAVACYTRAFRGLRAATILATSGLYLEARVYIRDVYESAGLARFLAKQPKKADDWLVRERWVKDNEVRQYIENFTLPGTPADTSPYRQYYSQASAVHHPTARGCIPLVLDGPHSACEPKLSSQYNAEELDAILLEIAMESIFVCFTVINAVPDPVVIDPKWRKAVSDLAAELAPGNDWSHLERDWTADQRAFDELRAHVIGVDGIDAALDQHPNSVRNTKRRRDQQPLG